MKTFFRIIILVLALVIWLVPFIISVIKDDFYLLFTYFVWWIPALIFSGLLIKIEENL